MAVCLFINNYCYILNKKMIILLNSFNKLLKLFILIIMSNLLELLSLNELNVRRENLLKQIDKVENEIKKRKKVIEKNNNINFNNVYCNNVDCNELNLQKKELSENVSPKKDTSKKIIKITVRKNVLL